MYVESLKKALAMIKDKEIENYFLAMKEMMDLANEHMFVGPARGSAAGSLVCYLLGITQVDPIKYNLLFERFLNEGREAGELPDIDVDVEDRDILMELFYEKYGKDAVFPISTNMRLKISSLIKDVSKFYDVPFVETNNVTGKMIFEATPIAKKKHGIKSGVYAPTFDEVMEYSESLKSFLIKYPQIKTHIDTLLGQVRSISRHAGGVVIGEA